MTTDVRMLILLVVGTLSLTIVISEGDCISLPCIEKGEVPTCKNKCGLARDVPCSCDVRCIALGNCCDNFTETCPGLAERSKHQLASLIHSRVFCSRTNNVLQIASCPGSEGESTQGDKHIGFGLRDEIDSYEKVLSTEGMLEAALINVPITDMSTGITYMNKDIFDCHVTLETDWLPWDIEMGVLKFKNPTSMRLLEEVSDLASLIHHPRAEIERVLDGSRCLADAIAECKPRRDGTEFDQEKQGQLHPDKEKEIQPHPDEVRISTANETFSMLEESTRNESQPTLSQASGKLDLNNELQNKPKQNPTRLSDLDELCRGPISYVTNNGNTRLINSEFYYKNRFCYECNKNDTNYYWPDMNIQSMKDIFKLSIIMKMTTDGRILVETKHDWVYDPPPWKRAFCIPATQTNKTSVDETREQMRQNNEEEDEESSLQNTRAKQKKNQMTKDIQEPPPETEEDTLHTNAEIKQGKCVIEFCDLGFSLRQDGTCKTMTSAKIAVSDDGYPLTEHEVRRLPSFVGCVLTDHVSQEVVRVNQSVSIVKGGNEEHGIPDKRLYVMSFDIYLHSKYESLARTLDTENELFVLVDVLAAFRLRRKDRVTNSMRGSLGGDFDILKAELPHVSVFDLLNRDTSIVRTPIQEKGDDDKTNASTITVCFGKPEYGMLGCMEDAVREKTVRNYVKSPCFTMFGANSQGTILESMTKPMFWALLILELVLII